MDLQMLISPAFGTTCWSGSQLQFLLHGAGGAIICQPTRIEGGSVAVQTTHTRPLDQDVLAGASVHGLWTRQLMKPCGVSTISMARWATSSFVGLYASPLRHGLCSSWALRDGCADMQSCARSHL